MIDSLSAGGGQSAGRAGRRHDTLATATGSVKGACPKRPQLQDSWFSHWPLPHTEHTPQSGGQEAQVSLALQLPSPQPGHWPQSCGQE